MALFLLKKKLVKIRGKMLMEVKEKYIVGK